MRALVGDFCRNYFTLKLPKRSPLHKEIPRIAKKRGQLCHWWDEDDQQWVIREEFAEPIRTLLHKHDYKVVLRGNLKDVVNV
jgi:hypothetical protein